MATKPRNPEFITPRGTFKFPSLSSPDYGNDEFPNPDGSFKTAVVMSAADAQPLIDKLMPAYEVALAEGAVKFAALALPARKKLGEMKTNMFYETEYDKETEEETGNVIFKAKTKYRRVNAKTKEVSFGRVILVDAKGKPFPKTLPIYGGTEGRISFTVRPYFIPGTGVAGLSMYLVSAQIINHVGPGARTGASLGYAVEDGFDSDDFVPEDSPVEGGEGAHDKSQGSNGNPQDF